MARRTRKWTPSEVPGNLWWDEVDREYTTNKGKRKYVSSAQATDAFMKMWAENPDELRRHGLNLRKSRGKYEVTLWRDSPAKDVDPDTSIQRRSQHGHTALTAPVSAKTPARSEPQAKLPTDDEINNISPAFARRVIGAENLLKNADNDTDKELAKTVLTQLKADLFDLRMHQTGLGKRVDATLKSIEPERETELEIRSPVNAIGQSSAMQVPESWVSDDPKMAELDRRAYAEVNTPEEKLDQIRARLDKQELHLPNFKHTGPVEGLEVMVKIIKDDLRKLDMEGSAEDKQADELLDKADVRLRELRNEKIVERYGDGTYNFPKLRGHQTDEYTIRESSAKAPPEGAGEIPAPDGLEYLPFQKAGILQAAEREGALIADEPGLGKTIQAIGLANQTGADRILVVAPKTVLANWRKESRRWLVDDLPIHNLNEDGWHPNLSNPEYDAVAVINYDALKKYHNEIREHPWDLVVLDETHDYIGSMAADRTAQIIGRLPKIKKNGEYVEGYSPVPVDRKLALSGTPTTSYPDRLWSVLSWTNPGYWGEPNSRLDRQRFLDRYVDREKMANGRTRVVGGKNEGELQRRMRSTGMIRRLKDDVLTDLPPKHRRTIVLEPSSADERAALAAERQYVRSLKDAEIQGISPPFEEISEMRHLTALAKAPAVARYIGDAARQEPNPVLYFGHHKDVLRNVRDHLESEGLSTVTITGDTPSEAREAAVDAVQDGDVEVFLATIGSAGTGLTLTRSNRVIFGELDWTPAKLSQAEDRAYRIGQDKPVLVEHIVLDGSLDQKLVNILSRKMVSLNKSLGVSDSSQVVDSGAANESDIQDAFMESVTGVAAPRGEKVQVQRRPRVSTDQLARELGVEISELRSMADATKQRPDSDNTYSLTAARHLISKATPGKPRTERDQILDSLLTTDHDDDAIPTATLPEQVERAEQAPMLELTSPEPVLAKKPAPTPGDMPASLKEPATPDPDLVDTSPDHVGQIVDQLDALEQLAESADIESQLQGVEKDLREIDSEFDELGGALPEETRERVDDALELVDERQDLQRKLEALENDAYEESGPRLIAVERELRELDREYQTTEGEHDDERERIRLALSAVDDRKYDAIPEFEMDPDIPEETRPELEEVEPQYTRERMELLQRMEDWENEVQGADASDTEELDRLATERKAIHRDLFDLSDPDSDLWDRLDRSEDMMSQHWEANREHRDDDSQPSPTDRLEKISSVLEDGGTVTVSTHTNRHHQWDPAAVARMRQQGTEPFKILSDGSLGMYEGVTRGEPRYASIVMSSGTMVNRIGYERAAQPDEPQPEADSPPLLPDGSAEASDATQGEMADSEADDGEVAAIFSDDMPEDPGPCLLYTSPSPRDS